MQLHYTRMVLGPPLVQHICHHYVCSVHAVELIYVDVCCLAVVVSVLKTVFTVRLVA